MTAAEKIRAATRDASWYRNPSTHGKDVAYHVVAPERGVGESACGTPLVVTEGFAPRLDVTVDAATVLPANRCQRPGCKARWPALNASGVTEVHAPRFQHTYCSQCGTDLGPGEHGVSSCCDHGNCQVEARGDKCECDRTPAEKGQR